MAFMRLRSEISSLPRSEGHRGRHGRGTCAKEVDQYGARIEATKTCSVDHAGEDLLGVGAAPGAIAARHLAIHDRRTERLFSAPVGGIDGRIKEESKDGR